VLLLTGPFGTGTLSLLLLPNPTQAGCSMLDTHQLAVNPPSPQHFTPTGKLWELEEKQGLPTLCPGSDRTGLLQALRRTTRN